ncbi:hypothetical protein PAAG_11643 [Paracoccidioides lutzii Pb01]|uniref:Uncharacterized protein n=1 Tax=Paracoccidioides lutzii (strain ATCC MYA-826 / Pb01) TaxID=502779 RepID=A0A0A2V5S2_PARBA|nr:hypothetical protein PAAG_11643 [Paracoccidioides lutzii Pb01]KGQ01652.1 hypothetical protein PAAG_11643 [Paracoccidioides lutzii Pb01]
MADESIVLVAAIEKMSISTENVNIQLNNICYILKLENNKFYNVFE